MIILVCVGIFILGVILSVVRMREELSISERIVYISYCILTFGLFWAIKVLIKVALIELTNKDK